MKWTLELKMKGEREERNINIKRGKEYGGEDVQASFLVSMLVQN